MQLNAKKSVIIQGIRIQQRNVIKLILNMKLIKVS